MSEKIITQEFINNYNILKMNIYYTLEQLLVPLDFEQGTCIDNCFAKTRNIQLESFKLNTSFNDHCPLFINMDHLKLKKASENVMTYINYNK